MLTIGQERSAHTEIEVGQNVRALTFTANGEYLVSGHEREVRVWRVKDGKQAARLEAWDYIHSLAASKNGKWIATGTFKGVVVWDAQTRAQVLKHKEDSFVRGVDFSPDSTRLAAGTDNGTAIIWDLGTGKQVQTLYHEHYVIAAKYSPLGDRIATATCDGPVRVWDSNDGHLLVDIKVIVTPSFNTGFFWSNHNFFVVSDKKIKEFDASTGSKVSEWPVSDANDCSCITLPKHEQFIAFSAKRTITFWETSTHDQLPLTVQHPEDIRSIAFSPDNRILAIGGGGKITFSSVSTVSCWVISSLNSFLAQAFFNPHDHPAAGGSVVDDKRCVLVRLARVNADHCRQERSAPTKIDVGQNVRALTFTANGEYLVTGDEREVRVWRVEDRKQVARMETEDYVLSLAASKNGRWIVAGTFREVVVWDAQTHRQVLKHKEDGFVRGVDFSPASTRLIAENGIAIVWDLGTGRQVQTLHHSDRVIAAKYSPRGDRIVTATCDGPVRVWDSNDGRLLVVIKVIVTPSFNTGLLWSKHHLFVVSDKTIKEFDASTGSKVSEWPVPDTNSLSSIALAKHGEFIAFSAIRTVTFWDTSTHDQLDLVQHHQDIRSIALSPDDRLLAFGGADKKITIQGLSHITVSAEAHRVYDVSDQLIINVAFSQEHWCPPEGVDETNNVGEYPMERCLTYRSQWHYRKCRSSPSLWRI